MPICSWCYVEFPTVVSGVDTQYSWFEQIRAESFQVVQLTLISKKRKWLRCSLYKLKKSISGCMLSSTHFKMTEQSSSFCPGFAVLLLPWL